MRQLTKKELTILVLTVGVTGLAAYYLIRKLSTMTSLDKLDLDISTDFMLSSLFMKEEK